MRVHTHFLQITILSSMFMICVSLAETHSSAPNNQALIQQLEAVRKKLLINEPVLTPEQKDRISKIEEALEESNNSAMPWSLPSSTVLTPSAYGAQWTDLFFGASIENRGRYGHLPNGTAMVGFGLGNPRSLLGLEVSVFQYGLNDFPFLRGGIGLKLHRILPYQVGIAAGIENAVMWEGPDSGQSIYAVVSKAFILSSNEKDWFSLLTLNAGAGDGRFRSESSIISGKQSITPFFAIGLRINRPIGIVAEWTGADATLGLSITPFHNFPIAFGFAAMDLLKFAGDGTRYAFSISYSDSVVSSTFPIGIFR